MSFLRKILGTAPTVDAPALVVLRAEVSPERLRLVFQGMDKVQRDDALRRAAATLHWRRGADAADEARRITLDTGRSGDGPDDTWWVDIPAPTARARWKGLRFDDPNPAAVTLPPTLRRQLAHLLPEAGECYREVFAFRSVRMKGLQSQVTLARQIVEERGRPAGERIHAATVLLYKAMESAPDAAAALVDEVTTAMDGEVDAALRGPGVETPAIMYAYARAQWLLGSSRPKECLDALLGLLSVAGRSSDLMTSAEVLGRAALLAGTLQMLDQRPDGAEATLRRVPKLFQHTVAVADPARLREFESLQKLLMCSTTAGQIWRGLKDPQARFDELASRALEVSLNIGGRFGDQVFARLGLNRVLGSPKGAP